MQALKHRALATTSGVGLLYNWGFFTLLGYSPFLMQPITPQQLGLVFCGWGVLVAAFAVWGAPWLKARFGTPRTLYGNFVLMAADLAVIAIWWDSKPTVIAAVIVAGAFVGTLFLNALKMLVVPLIVSSLIQGLLNLNDPNALSRMGLKAVAYYMMTCLLAVLVGLAIVNLIQPGIIDGEPAGVLLGLKASGDDVVAKLGHHDMGDIVGVFTRLWKRDGKPAYLSLIPRVWAQLERDLAHPALAPVAEWFDANIPQALRDELGGHPL